MGATVVTNTRPDLGPAWHACPDRPTFHVAPPSGFAGDPNGVAWHADANAKEGYALHVFFQYAPGPHWDWGIAWGHAVSADGGATWMHRGVALRPSPGFVDVAGVWSGCCVPADAGGAHAATILYTGVRQRTDPEAADHPMPPDADLGSPVHEVVCAAVSSDAGLTTWTKAPILPIPHAPPGRTGGTPPPVPPADKVKAMMARGVAPRTWHGFRDPFVYQRPSRDAPVWRLLMGTGADGCGTALVYESDAVDPAAPAWRLAGEIVTGTPRSLPGCDGNLFRGLGCCWECPTLVPVPVWDDGGDARDGGEVGALSPTWRPPPPRAADATDAADLAAGPVVFIASPHTGGLDPPRAPPIAWVGELRESKGRKGRLHTLPLDAASTVGPVVTDLGCLLYAMTAARPPPGASDGRPLALAHFQEDDGHAGGGGGDYSGCLSLPRRLWCDRNGDGGVYRLRQSADPAVCVLRVGPPTRTPRVAVGDGGDPVPLLGAAGAALDVRATLRPAPAGDDQPTRIMLRSRPHAGADTAGALCTVALVADWAAGTLAAVWTDATGTVAARVGGPCADVAAGELRVRVLVDGSAVEVFTGCGAALTFRVYGRAEGERLLLDGESGATATDVAVWRMRPCWAHAN